MSAGAAQAEPAIGLPSGRLCSGRQLASSGVPVLCSTPLFPKRRLCCLHPFVCCTAAAAIMARAPPILCACLYITAVVCAIPSLPCLAPSLCCLCPVVCFYTATCLPKGPPLAVLAIHDASGCGRGRMYARRGAADTAAAAHLAAVDCRGQPAWVLCAGGAPVELSPAS